MTLARLILAIVSTLAVEVAFYSIWRWLLPELDITVPVGVLVAVMVGWAIFAIVDFWFVTTVLRRKTLIGLPDMVGTLGKVTSTLNPDGLVRIRGELWGAKALDGAIDIGEKVVVVGQEGLQLVVRRG